MKQIKLFAVLLLVLALLAGAAAQAEEQPSWNYNSDSYCARPNGTLSGDVMIPAEVNGYAVNAIGFNTFFENHEVTALTMPESLRALQSGAISSMNGLTNVTLNEGLEYIGTGNFSRCPSLTTLTIPAGVRIFEASIQNCENLKEIRFEGECPIFLGKDFSFFMMPEDYVIYVPDDQLEAYAAALADCGNAAEHLQPGGKNAATVAVEDKESRFAFDATTGTITGTAAGNADYHAFLEIPATIGGVAVKSVGEGAFSGDYSIYGVVFPEGLERIESDAFKHASSIEYIRFPSTLRTIGDNAFFNVQAESIGWSEGLEEIGAQAFRYNHETVLTLPSTLRSIGESAFEDSWMNELYLGGNMESIGSRAFANCKLTYMAFDFYAPIDIAPDAFADNGSLADLDLPWDCSFENRDAYAALLAEQCPDCKVWINNPVSAGVAEYPEGERASSDFVEGVWTEYEGDLENLTVWPNAYKVHVTGLGDGLFKGNQSIRSFYPHHCGWFTTIGNEAFADSSVEYVELFGSVTTIGEGAFRNCTNITEMTLPASLTSIGEDALDGCDHLSKLTVLCDPSVLPDNLLTECAGLVEVYAAPDATEEQLARLSILAGRPWYAPVSRVGEEPNALVEMPYATLPGEDFQYDKELGRLDRYNGYELNLYLPREIDGVGMNRIGGGMMSRAAHGDNRDIELPVRSLVIPENYTEIPYWAFANCETLETVICYAPIENLEDSMFKNCTALREVIFVNGVRNLGKYVFDGCTSLETVYVGPYLENISEYTFLNEDRSVAFDQNNIITDPTQLPEVDALLQAVKSDPMPAPEPTATPAPAMPVGVEGEPYIGTWRGETMEMEAMVVNLAEMGITMELTLNADGTASMSDGEEAHETTWTVTDGVAFIENSPMILTEDGKLCMEEDGMKMVFGMGEDVPTPVQTSDIEVVSGDRESFIGTWTATTMEMDGAVCNMADLGMEMELTLNADGTATMGKGEELERSTWTFEDGKASVEGIALVLTENGSLCMEDEDGKLYFSPAEITDTDSEPESLSETRLEQKYICVNAEIGEYTVDADKLGGEYSLVFHADGTTDFVMAGTLIAGLSWTQENKSTDAGEATVFVVDYYGSPMEAVWTDEGFDMNYFDSMLIHFVPVE